MTLDIYFAANPNPNVNPTQQPTPGPTFAPVPTGQTGQIIGSPQTPTGKSSN